MTTNLEELPFKPSDIKNDEEAEIALDFLLNPKKHNDPLRPVVEAGLKKYVTGRYDSSVQISWNKK